MGIIFLSVVGKFVFQKRWGAESFIGCVVQDKRRDYIKTRESFNQEKRFSVD